MIPDANDVAQSYFDALMQQPIRDDSSNPTTNITMALVMEQLEQRMTAVLRELDKSLSDSQQSAALLTMKLQNYQNTQHKIEASLSVWDYFFRSSHDQPGNINEDITAKIPRFLLNPRMATMTRGEREEADSSRQFDGLILSDGGYQKKLATMLADSSSGNSDSSFFHPSDISFACPPNESHHNSSTHNRFSTGSTDSEGCLSSFMSPLSNIGSYNTLSMVDSNYHQFRSPSSSNLKKGNLPTMLPPLSSTVKRNSIVSLDADLEDDEEDDDLTAKLLATPSTSRPLDFSLVPETFQTGEPRSQLVAIYNLIRTKGPSNIGQILNFFPEFEETCCLLILDLLVRKKFIQRLSDETWKC